MGVWRKLLWSCEENVPLRRGAEAPGRHRHGRVRLSHRKRRPPSLREFPGRRRRQHADPAGQRQEVRCQALGNHTLPIVLFCNFYTFFKFKKKKQKRIIYFFIITYFRFNKSCSHFNLKFPPLFIRLSDWSPSAANMAKWICPKLTFRGGEGGGGRLKTFCHCVQTLGLFVVHQCRSDSMVQWAAVVNLTFHWAGKEFQLLSQKTSSNNCLHCYDSNNIGVGLFISLTHNLTELSALLTPYQGHGKSPSWP